MNIQADRHMHIFCNHRRKRAQGTQAYKQTDEECITIIFQIAVDEDIQKTHLPDGPYGYGK
jgi:hypothetical protein